MIAEATSARTGAISWIENDYAAALARAKAEKKPLFLDGWARWCAPCLSMRDTVLADPTVQSRADRFVWVSLDDDREDLRPIELRFTIRLLPTFVVVDPSHDVEVGRWIGTADPRTFRRFLDDAERWFRITTSLVLSPLDAGRAHAEKNDAYGAPKDTPALLFSLVDGRDARWGRRAEVQAEMLSIMTRESDADCPFWSLKLLAEHRHDHDVTTLEMLEAAMTCVRQNVRSSFSSDVRAAVRETLDEMVSASNEPSAAPSVKGTGDEVKMGASSSPTPGASSSPTPGASSSPTTSGPSSSPTTAGPSTGAGRTPLCIEDRDAALSLLRQLALDARETSRAQALSTQRLALLEQAASLMTDRRDGSRYDLLRAIAMAEIGQENLAVTMLKNTQAELSDEADPTLRLATFFLHVRRWNEALDEAEDGLKHTSGMRVAKLLHVKGESLIELGRRDEGRDALSDELKLLEGLPRTMRNASAEQRLRARISGSSPLP